ncbi:MAG: hypothetical protein QM775_12515 [Pirellulales bacterium]
MALDMGATPPLQFVPTDQLPEVPIHVWASRASARAKTATATQPTSKRKKLDLRGPSFSATDDLSVSLLADMADDNLARD